MTVSISIMAHESRKEYIPYIHEKLGYECPVAWERGLGRRDTGARAWVLHDPKATHHLVLQDDVLLSTGLPGVLGKLVEAVPDQPISLFAHDRKAWNKLIDQCARRCMVVRWLVLQRLNWGPAVMLPVKDIEPMIAWTERNVFLPNYDMAIAYYYLSARGVPIWYCMPSLVDHRCEGESLVWDKKNQKGRRARYFVGEQQSGMMLDWRGENVYEIEPMEKYLRNLMLINESCRLKADPENAGIMQFEDL